jgi:hypothetical protein
MSAIVSLSCRHCEMAFGVFADGFFILSSRSHFVLSPLLYARLALEYSVCLEMGWVGDAIEETWVL